MGAGRAAPPSPAHQRPSRGQDHSIGLAHPSTWFAGTTPKLHSKSVHHRMRRHARARTHTLTPARHSVNLARAPPQKPTGQARPNQARPSSPPPLLTSIGSAIALQCNRSSKKARRQARRGAKAAATLLRRLHASCMHLAAHGSPPAGARPRPPPPPHTLSSPSPPLAAGAAPSAGALAPAATSRLARLRSSLMRPTPPRRPVSAATAPEIVSVNVDRRLLAPAAVAGAGAPAGVSALQHRHAGTPPGIASRRQTMPTRPELSPSTDCRPSCSDCTPLPPPLPPPGPPT